MISRRFDGSEQSERPDAKKKKKTLRRWSPRDGDDPALPISLSHPPHLPHQSDLADGSIVLNTLLTFA